MSLVGLIVGAGSFSAAWGASCTVPGGAGCSTIQAALDQSAPGDTIEVETGIYSEKIHFPTSGTAGNAITLQAATGHDPVLDGTGVTSDNMVLIDTKSYINLIGFEIRNNLNVNDGSGVRIIGSGTHVEIRDNVIHEIRGDDAMGITVYGTEPTSISNLIIDGNEIYDCDPAQSEALTLNGNVEDFEVTNNTVRDVNNIAIDFIGGETDIQPDSNLVARNGLVRGNTVINANSNYGGGYAGGVYVDGGRNIVIENNTITGSDLGIEIGAENTGLITENITVRNNVVYLNEKAGIVFGGFEAGVGRANNNTFRGNTLYKNNTLGANGSGTYFNGNGIGEIWVQFAEDNVIENNIIYANAQNVLIASYDNNSSSNNTFDYNLFFSDDIANADFSMNGDFYTGLASWQSGENQDANSSAADPLFVDADNADFHLIATSPAVDAGNPGYTPASGETDLDGSTRASNAIVDIGADEVTCGDTVTDPGEECDDGNTTNGDGCDNNCTATACGNSIVTAGEVCDDGNTDEMNDCCLNDCTLKTVGSTCDDLNSCTIDDQCNASGTCVTTPIAGVGCGLDKEVRKCQEAISKAGKTYLATRLTKIQKCRDKINKGKQLYRDKNKTMPLGGPDSCESEYATEKTITKIGTKSRNIIAKTSGTPKCTDALLAQLSVCASTVDPLIDTEGDSGCFIETIADEVDTMIDDGYGTTIDPASKDVRKCQEAIAKAGRIYALKRYNFLRGCRDKLNKGKSLYKDKDKTDLLQNPAECEQEYKTDLKLTKARIKVRNTVAKKCDDTLLADPSMADACATTVDGLVSIDASTGCLLIGHTTAVDTVVDALY